MSKIGWVKDYRTDGWIYAWRKMSFPSCRNAERNSWIRARIRRFVLCTSTSEEGEKEGWLVQSRNQALSKGALRTVVGGKKQRLRCVPVSRLGSPRTWPDFSRGRREKPARLGFDTVLDNPYSFAPEILFGQTPPSILLRWLLLVLSPWWFSRRLLKPQDIFARDNA